MLAKLVVNGLGRKPIYGERSEDVNGIVPFLMAS